MTDDKSTKPLKHPKRRCLYHPTAQRRLMAGFDELVRGSGRVSPDEEERLFKALNFCAYAVNKAVKKGASKRTVMRWRHKHHDARDRLVRANVGLVYDLVHRSRFRNIEHDEMVSESMFTLLQAIDAFDPWMGYRFSTYACNAILRTLARISKAESKRRSRQPVQFDPEFEIPFGDSERRENATELYVERLQEAIQDEDSVLTDAERDVLARRFPEKEEMRRETLEQIGAAIQVSKERVRQIQNSALAKLRDVLTADPVLQ